MDLKYLRAAGISGVAALLMLFASPSLVSATPHPLGVSQDRDDDWDHAPRDWNDIQRQGFHDGIEGARHDFGNHRQPDVNNREEYRTPDVPREMRHAYREAFRRGYQVGMSHLMGGGPGPGPGPRMQQPMGPPPRPWNAAPDWFNDAQRRGFQDGMDGAQKDFGNHRQPDVNNRWEYQKPNLPPPMWGPYREGFRRGYAVAMSHLMGTPPPAAMPWNYVPPEFNDFQRRGFQDGIVGAQKDYGNHRQPNVNNREEYRDPDGIPPQMRAAYQEGFRRGYDVGWDHIMGRDHDRY